MRQFHETEAETELTRQGEAAENQVEARQGRDRLLETEARQNVLGRGKAVRKVSYEERKQIAITHSQVWDDTRNFDN